MNPRHSFSEQQLANNQQGLSQKASNLIVPVSDIAIHKMSDFCLEKEQLSFCYKIALKAIQACIDGDYTKFDALTATRCCHGIALKVLTLIEEVLSLDLENLLREAILNNDNLEKEYSNGSHKCLWYLPKPLIELSRLYVLTLIKEEDSKRVARTNVLKLKEIGPVSRRFCDNIVNNLQEYFSNLVARSYSKCVENLNNEVFVNGNSIYSWAKYISPQYLKKDRRNRFYASSLFSMMVSLGIVIHGRYKVALISDISNSSDSIEDRYVKLYEGNGQSDCRLFSLNEGVGNLNEREPVIIYGGFCKLQTKKSSYFFKMGQWESRFAEVILANEMDYPQFPEVRDDPNFDFSYIHPKERKLKDTIQRFSTQKGFSLNDPSIFCLTHVYVGSLKQVLATINQEKGDSLPLNPSPQI